MATGQKAANSFSNFLEKRKGMVYIILFFTLLNFVLRSIYLTKNPLSGDEPFSLYHAQMPIQEIIAELLQGNNPPLFEIILHYWIKLGSISIGWIRLLPLIFSVLTVPFLYLLAHEIKKGWYPIFVVLIYTFSSYHLQFGQEVRVYSLFGLLSVISFWLLLRTLRQSDKKKLWMALLIVNSILIYAHYFGFFVLLIQTIFVFLLRKKTFIRSYSWYVVGMIILYLPMISTLFSRFILNESDGKLTWLESPDSIEAIYNMLWKFSNKPIVTVIGITLLVVVVSKMIYQRKWKLSNEALLLTLWFSISLFGMFLISFKIPMFLDRYLIYGSFSYLLILIYALDDLFLSKKIMWMGSGILVVLFLGTFSLNVPSKRDAKLIAETVHEAVDDTYDVFIYSPEQIPHFTYYYSPKWFQLIDTQPLYKRIIDSLQAEGINFVWSENNLLDQTENKVLFIQIDKGTENDNHPILLQLRKERNELKKIQLDEISYGYYFDALDIQNSQ